MTKSIGYRKKLDRKYEKNFIFFGILHTEKQIGRKIIIKPLRAYSRREESAPK